MHHIRYLFFSGRVSIRMMHSGDGLQVAHENLLANDGDTIVPESGDREAVHTFMHENRPAGIGTGFWHDGPFTE